MKSIFIILIVFLGIGLFVSKFNTWTRLLMLSIIIGMIFYITYL